MCRRLFFIIFSLISAYCCAQSLTGSRGDNPVIPPARTPEVADDEEDVLFILFGEADKAIAEGDYATAERRIIEALSLDRDSPQNTLLLSNLGMVYSYQDRDSLALEALNEALRRAPAMTTVLANRAMVYLHLGDDKAALDDFAKIISLDSLNLNARYYHGVMSLYSGRLADAQADLQVLADRDPDGIPTATAMATMLTLTAREREAIPYYRTLIEKDPSPEYYGALATCQLTVGELSDASRTIADGLLLYPDDAMLYYCRAWLHRDSYRNKEAREDAARAKRLGADPARVDALFKKR